MSGQLKSLKCLFFVCSLFFSFSEVIAKNHLRGLTSLRCFELIRDFLGQKKRSHVFADEGLEELLMHFDAEGYSELNVQKLIFQLRKGRVKLWETRDPKLAEKIEQVIEDPEDIRWFQKYQSRLRAITIIPDKEQEQENLYLALDSGSGVGQLVSDFVHESIHLRLEGRKLAWDQPDLFINQEHNKGNLRYLVEEFCALYLERSLKTKGHLYKEEWRKILKIIMTHDFYAKKVRDSGDSFIKLLFYALKKQSLTDFSRVRPHHLLLAAFKAKPEDVMKVLENHFYEWTKRREELLEMIENPNSEKQRTPR